MKIRSVAVLSSALALTSSSAFAAEDHAPLVFRAGIEATAGGGLHLPDSFANVPFGAVGARGQLGIQRGIFGACATLDAQTIYGKESGIALGLGIMNDYTFLDDHLTIGGGVGFGPRFLSQGFGSKTYVEWWPDLRLAWNPLVSAGDDSNGYRRKALVIGADIRLTIANDNNVFFAPIATIGYQAF